AKAVRQGARQVVWRVPPRRNPRRCLHNRIVHEVYASTPTLPPPSFFILHSSLSPPANPADKPSLSARITAPPHQFSFRFLKHRNVLRLPTIQGTPLANPSPAEKRNHGLRGPCSRRSGFPA